MMKNIIFIISFVLIGLNGKAQTNSWQVIPLDELGEHQYIPDHTYLKDVNHALDDYVGTWIGTYDNKTYKLFVVKKIGWLYAGSKTVKWDKLLVRYKIIDSGGNIIVNTTNRPDDDLGVISGIRFTDKTPQKYYAYYGGEYSAACGNTGILYFQVVRNLSENETQMRVNVAPKEVWLNDEDCPDGYVGPPFPPMDEPSMILTKQ